MSTGLFLALLSLSVAAGCAGQGGSLPWQISDPPRTSLPLQAHFIYLAPSTAVSQIEKIANAGDVNHDGSPDLRIIYDVVQNPVPARRNVVVLSGTTFPIGAISKLRREKRIRYDSTSVVHLSFGRYRTSRLTDLNGDGRAERAVLRTRHRTTHYACGETRCTTNYSASELKVYSGKDEIGRLGGDWYPSADIYYDNRPYHTVIGGYSQMGDSNGDGRPDLLYDDGWLGVMVLTFTGSGSEAQMRVQKLSALANGYLMPAAVDLNSDGKPEVAAQALRHSGAYETWLAIVLLSPR
jgi:hypothetical protein